MGIGNATNIFKGKKYAEAKAFNRIDKNLTFEKRVENAMKMADERIKNEAICKIARNLLADRGLTVIERMGETDLKKECGDYCEPEDLVAVCTRLEEIEREKEEAKWEKYN